MIDSMRGLDKLPIELLDIIRNVSKEQNQAGFKHNAYLIGVSIDPEHGALVTVVFTFDEAAFEQLPSTTRLWFYNGTRRIDQIGSYDTHPKLQPYSSSKELQRYKGSDGKEYAVVVESVNNNVFQERTPNNPYLFENVIPLNHYESN